MSQSKNSPVRDARGRFVKATAAPTKPAVPSPAEIAAKATLRRAVLNQQRRIQVRLDALPTQPVKRREPTPAERRANGYRGVLTRAELARRAHG